MLVHELLSDAVARRPDATALVCGEQRLTYRQVDALSGKLAAVLRAHGTRRGDRVVLLLDNRPETVVGIFGALRAGAAFTVLSPGTRPQKLAGILASTRASAIIAPRRSAAVLALSLLPTHAQPRLVLGVDDGDLSQLSAAAARPATADVDDLGCIIWTSGTTGRPKGVMSLHRDMVFATRAIASYLGNSGDDVIFCSLSLGFTYGLYQLLAAVAVGATLVLEPGFVFPHDALSVMARERVTGLPGVPTMFSLLLRMGGLERYDLSSLRYITNAAAPLTPDQLTALAAAFPQAEVFSMYGQTECKRVCYLPPDQIAVRPASVGVPIPGTSAFVIGDDGLPAAPGVVGELVVQGPHLMSGYWECPDDTAQRLRPWPGTGESTLYTGDLFRTDGDGYLYFVSRADDIIKCRGEKVAPAEVEACLRELAGVADAAVIGVPDPVVGEAVTAFIVAEPGSSLTVAAVRMHCARQLEPHQVPTHVEFRDALPRSENGKTLRRKLRACVA